MCRYRVALALLLLAASAACGEKRETPDVPPPTPGEALAQLREAWQAESAVDLRARLDAWPLDDAAFADAPETQTVLLWRVQIALQDGAVERAEAAYDLLVERFDEPGTSPQGRVLSARVVSLGLFEECLLQARRRIEGPTPDPAGARSALAVAGRMLEEADAADRVRREGVTRWVEMATLADLLAGLGALPASAVTRRSRALVLTGDFTLGESVFSSVLSRWARDGRDAGTAVEVVPLLRGQVRYGLRLVPAESRREELASIQGRIEELGVARTDLAGLREGIPAERLEHLGLAGMDVAIVIVDDRGRLVGRLSGTTLDPRALDPVMQRVMSR